MRIIAGEARGRVLIAPKGDGTRPTTDRVRESLMSAVNSALGGFDDVIALDAFAGSGALGLEALSRGAKFAVLCDRDNAALEAIAANVKACKAQDVTRVYKGDILKSVPACRAGAYSLVFLDPPYAYSPEIALSVVEKAASSGLLVDDALIIYEHVIGNDDLVDEVAKTLSLSLLRRKKYGETQIDIFERSL